MPLRTFIPSMQMYGFEGEVKAKYTATMAEVFRVSGGAGTRCRA
jgi:hypothetical protein